MISVCLLQPTCTSLKANEGVTSHDFIVKFFSDGRTRLQRDNMTGYTVNYTLWFYLRNDQCEIKDLLKVPPKTDFCNKPSEISIFGSNNTGKISIVFEEYRESVFFRTEVKQQIYRIHIPFKVRSYSTNSHGHTSVKIPGRLLVHASSSSLSTSPITSSRVETAPDR